MAAVSQCYLEINGEEIDDFTEITEPKVEYNKSVQLMHRTTHIKVTLRYPGISLKYVVPDDHPEYDFSKVEDATLTIIYENGTRRVYYGVYCTAVGGETYKDGTETVRDVEFSAEKRDPA